MVKIQTVTLRFNFISKIDYQSDMSNTFSDLYKVQLTPNYFINIVSAQL